MQPGDQVQIAIVVEDLPEFFVLLMRDLTCMLAHNPISHRPLLFSNLRIRFRLIRDEPAEPLKFIKRYERRFSMYRSLVIERAYVQSVGGHERTLLPLHVMSHRHRITRHRG